MAEGETFTGCGRYCCIGLWIDVRFNSDGMNEDYGTITVGAGKPDQRELKIVNYVRSIFKDNRFAQCGKLEDGSYFLSIENLESSGRNPQNVLWLSEESFAAFFANAHLYFSIAGIDLTEITKKALNGKEIKYTVSDNLEPLKFEP